MTPQHLLIALLVPMTWGFGFALAKAGLDHFPPLLLMGLRFTTAALILIWFYPYRGGTGECWGSSRWCRQRSNTA